MRHQRAFEGCAAHLHWLGAAVVGRRRDSCQARSPPAQALRLRRLHLGGMGEEVAPGDTRAGGRFPTAPGGIERVRARNRVTTIADVARLAGVGTTTVTKVLANRKYVSE